VQEGLHAMRTAWAGKPFQLRSSRWHVDGNSALPAPIRNRWCGPRETRVRPSRWPRDHVTAGLHSRSRVSAPRRPNGSGESGREAHKAPRALSHAAARSCPTRPVGRVPHADGPDRVERAPPKQGPRISPNSGRRE
jgi:hypothetical protein